jgi:hypothetical protein
MVTPKINREKYNVACFECGRDFETEYAEAKYCGDKCRKKHSNRVNYQNRKARMEAERGQAN